MNCIKKFFNKIDVVNENLSKNIDIKQIIKLDINDYKLLYFIIYNYSNNYSNNNSNNNLDELNDLNEFTNKDFYK